MTQDVTHTLSDELLLAYSLGRLPDVFDLVVATHISLSDDARTRLEAFDAVGGTVMEEAAPIEMAIGSLEATLALIDSRQMPRSRPKANALFPQPLFDFIGGDLDRVTWRGMGMGVRQAILQDRDGSSVRLLSIPPGAAVPDHGHRGLELTLVLQGAFRDGDAEYHRGDIEEANEAVEHSPQVVGEEVCICLAATTERLRFSSLLPRLAQPFLRI